MSFLCYEWHYCDKRDRKQTLGLWQRDSSMTDIKSTAQFDQKLSWVCFVTQPELPRGSEILFYMQTGTINCINWTFNFSQQYLGKVLVQYIHPSDILRVCYIWNIFSYDGTAPCIRCRLSSGKFLFIMRRRARALFMGHMIQLLLHH